MPVSTSLTLSIRIKETISQMRLSYLILKLKTYKKPLFTLHGHILTVAILISVLKYELFQLLQLDILCVARRLKLSNKWPKMNGVDLNITHRRWNFHVRIVHINCFVVEGGFLPYMSLW
jgi:hypothetical protein